MKPLNCLPARYGLALAAALLFTAHAASADTSAGERVARGKYLASAGDCVSCHTAKGGTPFAGGLMMKTPFGTVSTPNITPDRATGIGNWSDDDFYRTMHEGIGKQGEYLYPVMPFPWYTKVTRDDALAIKAYLFTLAPVNKARAANDLAFPFTVRTALGAWRAVFFAPGEFHGDDRQSAQINRGDYLVNGLGHCGECHNSRLLAGASRFQKPLQGGEIDGWYAPNITADVRDGIGSWTEAQLVQFLRSGSAPGKGLAVGPMAEAVHSLKDLTDDDLHAIAAYLKSTPPVGDAKARDPASAQASATGADAYLNRCASCHGVEGEGQPGVVPALKGNGAVQAQGPQNVIQVVLGGLEARQGYAPMLAIGAAMDDGEVADVLNYVRTRWGHADATAVTASTVHDERGQTAGLMTSGVRGDCPTIAPPALARAIADPHQGIARRLGETTELNMPQQVQAIVARSHSAAPQVAQADMVNGLLAAYCQAVHRQPGLDDIGKALRLGHFGQLVYVQLHSKGSVASGS